MVIYFGFEFFFMNNFYVNRFIFDFRNMMFPVIDINSRVFGISYIHYTYKIIIIIIQHFISKILINLVYILKQIRRPFGAFHSIKI